MQQKRKENMQQERIEPGKAQINKDDIALAWIIYTGLRIKFKKWQKNQ